MSGFFAVINNDAIDEISDDLAALSSTKKSSLEGILIFGGEVDSRISLGRLRWVGPALPDFAIRIAFAVSEAISSTF